MGFKGFKPLSFRFQFIEKPFELNFELLELKFTTSLIDAHVGILADRRILYTKSKYNYSNKAKNYPQFCTQRDTSHSLGLLQIKYFECKIIIQYSRNILLLIGLIFKPPADRPPK
jgi:hypothetical protein